MELTADLPHLKAIEKFLMTEPSKQKDTFTHSYLFKKNEKQKAIEYCGLLNAYFLGLGFQITCKLEDLSKEQWNASIEAFK